MTLDALYVRIINSLPSGAICVLFVLLCVLVSQFGLSLFNWWYNHQKLPQSNEVAGIMFGAISLIYSLILAFVIVAVWEDYEDLNKTIENEADKINGMLSHSTTLPDSLKQPLGTALYTYCKRVINEEWRMKQSEEVDQPSAIPNLRLMLLNLEPQNEIQESIFSVLDNDLSSISELRRNRLSHNRSHVPALVWLILKAGSIMMILFSYFFSVASIGLKRIYLLFLVSCIAMCMFLVYTLDHPFNGSAQVSSKPYQNILLELKQYYAISQE